MTKTLPDSQLAWQNDNVFTLFSCHT